MPRSALVVHCGQRPGTSFGKAPAKANKPKPGNRRGGGPPGRRGKGQSKGAGKGAQGKEKGKEPTLAAGGPVTPPMEVAVQEQLTPLDKMSQPLWSTFCGVTNGVWQGRMAAFYAATGAPEAVSLDGKTPVYDLHTLVVEARSEENEIQRHTLRSTKLPDIRAATLPSPGTAQPSPAAKPASKDWESDVLAEGEDGLVIFDGGTFSRGPHYLLSPQLGEEGEAEDDSAEAVAKTSEPGQEDEFEEGDLELLDSEEEGTPQPSTADIGDDPPRQISVIEQCLAWGGEQRLRLILTLSVGVEKGELDVEVLRTSLYREAWQGLSEDCEGESCVGRDVSNPDESATLLSTAPRVSARSLEGQWKAYDLSAVPVEEDDPLTGEMQRILLYYNQETRQQWSLGKPGKSTQGAALWLPNSVLVELQMVAPSSRGMQADLAEGMSAGSGRGFLITFSWAVKDSMVIGVHREYDASGELLECRSRSAVRGSWVGGSM